MLRYNKSYQDIADRFARESRSFDFALYVGHYHDSKDWLAFRPMHSDSIRRCEGLPIYILVNEDGVDERVIDCFAIMDQVLKHDIYAKGRKIFKELERKYYADDFANNKEREFAREILQAARGSFEEPIELNDIYLFLQEGKRLGRHVLVVPYEECVKSQQHDGWSYYLKLGKEI